jgi:alpha-ketoglutarate-dependent taurine dioxygenase
MKHTRQDWKDRDVLPLLNNEIDLQVIENVPCSQVEIWNYFSNFFTPAPQDPMDQMFVNIISDERGLAKENLKGNTELEWHIDKGYSDRPPQYVALYSVDMDENAGNTLFVDSRITDEILDYYNKYRYLKTKFDMNRFIHDEQYGYHFRSEAERRWFRRRYRSIEHNLFNSDRRGNYLYYCEAYNDIPEMDRIKKILYDSNRVYRHQWRKGELLIYNNLATNHKRENSGTKRHLWKIALYEK